VGLPPGLGGGKSGLRALRELWLNLQSAYELRRIRCERRSRETRRVNVTRPASADCASSWLQELLTLLLQLQHVLRRTQIDPFVERERGQQGRAPINQLHEFDFLVARANAAPYHTRLECHLILSSGVRPCAMYQVRLHGGLGDELVDPGRALPSFLKSARRSMPGTDRGRDRRLPSAGGK
jgi:hypothetical protein